MLRKMPLVVPAWSAKWSGATAGPLACAAGGTGIGPATAMAPVEDMRGLTGASHIVQRLGPAANTPAALGIPDSVVRGPVSEGRVAPTAYRLWGKRVLEVVLVVLSLPVVVPLMALLVVALWFEGGRAFFPQRRLGQGGRVFTMWKLRTMVPDAEARLERTLAEDPALRDEWTRTQKLRRDPRITALGRMLRKTSLDELPQFWNVLRGDMSLVGPRPMLPEQRPYYPGTAYFRLRPGVTGLWQVSDRNNSSFAARADFDTLYDEILSPGLDLRVMLATATVMVRATGH